MNEQNPVTPVLTKKQAQRANSTVVGMLIAIGVTLALALPVLLLVPQKKADSFERRVDVASVSAQAGSSAGFRPAAPTLPHEYPSNHADLDHGGQGQPTTWNVGYITPSKTYMQFVQTNKANETWIAQQAKGPKVGTKKAGGAVWDVYAAGGGDQSWVSQREGSTYIISGQASEQDKTLLAEALAKTSPRLEGQSAPSPTSKPTS